MSIVLVSRSQDKLQRVAKEIQDEFGVDVKNIAADFSKTDIYDHIEQGLSGLINNVGMGHEMEFFLDVENW